tara:strand:- start:435 stop:710 length:276 start_codon:yes stop_codon:yes gene_type:complete
MTNYADVVSDVEKVKEEGLKTEEEVKNWAMKHGYGLAVLDEFVAEWQGKPKVVEEVAPEPEPEPVVEEVKEEAVEEVKPAVKTKKSLFGKN